MRKRKTKNNKIIMISNKYKVMMKMKIMMMIFKLMQMMIVMIISNKINQKIMIVKIRIKPQMKKTIGN